MDFKIFCRYSKVCIFINEKSQIFYIFLFRRKFQKLINKFCKNEKKNGLKSANNLLLEKTNIYIYI